MAFVAPDVIETALRHHRAGDLVRAEALYHDALRIDPRHSEALHLLGMVAFQRQQNVAAIDYIGQAIDADRRRAEYHSSLGNVYRALGQPVEAMEALLEAIRLKPEFSEAYTNLGTVLSDCGQGPGAAACFERAAQLDPRNAHAWTNLGVLHLRADAPREAAGCFEKGVQANPGYVPALRNLGRCQIRDGRVEQGIVWLERALQLDGESADVLKDLAGGYLSVGRSPDAEKTYRRAIERSPKDPVLLLNLAQALKDQGKHPEAIEWYRRGLQLDPGNAAAHYTLGRALHLADQFAEAIESYRRSLALGSKDPKAAHQLGNACKSLARFDEALDAYRQALEWDPEFLPALHQMGNVHRQQNDLEGARLCLEKVLERKPDDLATLISLGNVLKQQDNQVGAAAAYRRVIAHLPAEPLWELWLATLCPSVFHNTPEIDQYREKLLETVERIGERGLVVTPEDIVNRGCPPPYNLQFHGRDNRRLKEAYAHIFRNCALGDLPRPAGKPRIGLVVTDGHELVFLRYLCGVLQRIGHKEFDPVIVCSAGGEGRIRAELSRETIETLVIPSRFDQIVERIRAAQFAVLYHWEIGSDITNYFLPFFRVAPVQCTGAGLPDTSGIPQIDYFLSNDVCELPRAERAYSERLIRARSPLTWQRPMSAPAGADPRADLGISEGQHLYLCPHKIEKFHPDFDGLIGGILHRDSDGVLIIPKDRQEHAARKLQNRLNLNLPHVADRIRFVPHQAVDGYFRLVQAADVLLDPIHYGGGLTAWDGLSLCKPNVTLPGPLVRGRYTAGFYRAIGIEDCVVATPDEYIDTAVRLASDGEWRRHVEERIRSTSETLFESADAVVEYEQIFERLIGEALERAR
jgi:tetratricopeptide (TPR) repeat protein